MGYTGVMEAHLHCACGWTGPRAMLRDRACPSCHRPADTPYGYPPYAAWQRPRAPEPASFVRPVEVAAPMLAPHRPCGRSGGSLCRSAALFAMTSVASFLIVVVYLNGGHRLRHHHGHAKPDHQRIECIMPEPRARVVVDPLKQKTPPPKYGQAPVVVPVPDGPKPPDARYGAYRPAPDKP